MGFRESGLEWDREGLSPTPNTSYSCYRNQGYLDGLGLGLFLGLYFMITSLLISTFYT